MACATLRYDVPLYAVFLICGNQSLYTTSTSSKLLAAVRQYLARGIIYSSEGQDVYVVRLVKEKADSHSLL